MSVKWKDLNLVGTASVRDLWLHSDLGMVDSMYTATVPSHGVVMLKVVGSGSQLQEVFEAEYGWINNFNLTSNSSVIAEQGSAYADASCSGGGKAGWLGNRADNYLEFQDVNANVEGNYNLTITYISGVNRNITMTINGKDTLLSNLNSGSWTTLKSSSYSVGLKKGNNTIRFSNSTGFMPDIDKIHIDVNKYRISTSLTEVKTSSIKIHPNPSSGLLQIDSIQPIKQVQIYSMTGTLLRTCYKSSINIADLVSGQYLLKITTSQGSIFQKILKS
jgi:hypothetical protein